MAAPDFLSDPRGIGLCLAEFGISVSGAQIQALSVYLDLLERWQSSINLVSGASLKDAVRRHILDSAQLVTFLPSDARRLVDLGSGAGFPGLVLAILRSDLEVYLVESDQKKCAFLESVSRETGVGVIVQSCRIEEAFKRLPMPDVLTARALAPLVNLLGYADPWFQAQPDLVALFPKGRDAAKEIEGAQGNWAFRCETFPSVTDPFAQILRVSALRKR